MTQFKQLPANSAKNKPSIIISPEGFPDQVLEYCQFFRFDEFRRVKNTEKKYSKMFRLFITICSLMAKKSLGAVCDENLNSACDQMTLQCFANKFIIDVQLEALFRMVFIDRTFGPNSM